MVSKVRGNDNFDTSKNNRAVVLVPLGNYSHNSVLSWANSGYDVNDFDIIEITGTTSNGVSGGGGTDAVSLSPAEFLSATKVKAAESTRDGTYTGFAHAGVINTEPTSCKVFIVANGASYSATLNMIRGIKL